VLSERDNRRLKRLFSPFLKLHAVQYHSGELSDEQLLSANGLFTAPCRVFPVCLNLLIKLLFSMLVQGGTNV